jgi:hypothetical protein
MQTVAGTLVPVVASIVPVGVPQRRPPASLYLLFVFLPLSFIPFDFITIALIQKQRLVRGSRKSQHDRVLRPFTRVRTRIVRWERSQT